MVAAVIDWLSAAGLTAWAGSGSVYPVANVLHLLGLVLLLGGIGVVDLAILGAFPALPKAALARSLTPFAIAGLILMALTGATLFAADAASLATSPVLRWKLITIALALTNAATFRWLLRPGPLQRLSAALSLAAWLTTATLGRMIAYT